MMRRSPQDTSDPEPGSTLPALLEPGCWQAMGPTRFDGRPALFLDRDGVLVEEVHYLGRPEDVALVLGAAAVVAAFNRAGVPVVLVTNQSGVARGYFGWADFMAVQAEIDRRLADHGARVDAVFACGYHQDGRGGLAVADHPWRKPRPGMLLAAREALGVDLARSVIVGDRAQDLQAGKAAGLSLGLQVATGYGLEAAERSAALALAQPGFEVTLAPDIGAALGVLDKLAEGLARC